MSDEPDHNEEAEANFFAMCLLVPEKLLSEEVEKMKGNNKFFDLANDRHMKYLSDKFKVPYHIITVRLMQVYGDDLAITF